MWLKPAFLKRFCLSHFSQPASDRPIYPVIAQGGIRRIVEFGVGAADRAVRMIELAGRMADGERIHYTGIDLFESRAASDVAGVSLKAVHRRLASTGARVRLLPGNPAEALGRSPMMPGTADLVVVAGDQDSASLALSWHLIERLVHDQSQVLLQEPGRPLDTPFRVVLRDELRRWSTPPQRRRAA